jgi:hypothetical protein
MQTNTGITTLEAALERVEGLYLPAARLLSPAQWLAIRLPRVHT